jgi:hypothetical protein
VYDCRADREVWIRRDKSHSYSFGT